MLTYSRDVAIGDDPDLTTLLIANGTDRYGYTAGGYTFTGPQVSINVGSMGTSSDAGQVFDLDAGAFVATDDAAPSPAAVDEPWDPV